MVELAGRGGSAEAAAAVTQLPFRLDDCQLGLSSEVAVRGAQRHRWDAAAERRRRRERQTGDRERKEQDEKYIQNMSMMEGGRKRQ